MHQLFGFQVTIDQTATKNWYAAACEWSCECLHCRNFLYLARQRALPAPILKILDALSIPPEKATYVSELYPVKTGHCYQFSYRIAGSILSGDEHISVMQDWGSARCCHEPYPYGAPDFPEPYFDLEFDVILPRYSHRTPDALDESH